MAIGELRETIDDLYNTPGKAELIGGRIVHLMSTGRKPNRVAGKIYRRLADYCESARIGEAYTDNMGFVVAELSSGRESFSPDVSYYKGPFSNNEMDFVEGPPTFAIEVRSKNGYGKSAESELAAKRADYFEAGTIAVWDVDPIAKTIALYLLGSEQPVCVFKHKENAHAEPAVPGWTIAVDEVFAS